MNNYLVPFTVTLNFLFFTAVFATVSIEPLCDDKNICTVKYKISDRFKLTCNVTSDDSVEVTWEKDGVPVTDIKDMNNRIKSTKESDLYTLHVNGATQDDGGNYTCVAKSDEGVEGRASLVVASKLYISTPDNINVVEGEKLRITCSVFASPLPEITWIVHDNEVYEVSRNRVKIMDDDDKKVKNAIFVIEDVNLGDRGTYTCKAHVVATNQTELQHTMVRVKDKYAALWPFLGICGEVFVLCAIILIYEKKRNKTELEESDTDQSPEQKNTPDHGGKDTNLRHRQ